jgi:hypothetical protein
MKTTSRLFAFFAAAALSLTLSAAPALANGKYTLAWGGNTDGQLDIPAAALSNSTKIAASSYHSIVLVNGRLYGCGSSVASAQSFLAGLQNQAFVATGPNSILSINEYGTAAFWTSSGTDSFRRDFAEISADANFQSGALGLSHGLLLNKNGAVKAWGYTDPLTAVSTPNAHWKSGFTAVAAGNTFSMGLSNGVVCVAAPAADPYKLLEIPAAATQIDPRTRKGAITAIAAGPYHAMALATNGEVLVWGAWTEEDSDDDDPIDDSFWTNAVPSKAIARAPVPRNSFGNVTNVPPAARSNVVAIAAGFDMCAALTDSGQVIVWGNEASDGSRAMANVPPYALQDIQAIALGYQHVLVRSSWLPPEFTGDSLPDAHLESEYSATVPLRADPAAVVSVVNPKLLPAGISLSADGVFSGIPTATNTPVTNTFQVVAANAYGSVTQSFSIVVKERTLRTPVWNTTELPPAVVGFPYGYQLGHPWFDLDATESPSFSADSQLPAWLSLDSQTGRLTGTPTAADIATTYPTFTAFNGVGSTNRLFQLAVGAPTGDTPPVIGLDFIPDLRVDSPASVDLQIIGASGVALSGELASAFVVVPTNGTWFLQGTPTAALQGDGRTANILASNSAASASAEYLVNVKGAPRWVTTSIPPAVIGTNYTAELEASWATSYEISASSLRPIPLSLSFRTNADSYVVAVLSGIPTNTVTTSFSIPVTAVNAYDNARRTFTLTLSDTPVPAGDPGYRFVSIVPSTSSLVLSWIVTNANADAAAVLVSTTNLLSWPTNGILYNSSPATISPLPSVPTHFRLQAP